MCYLNYFLFLHMPVFESKSKQAEGFSFSLEVMLLSSWCWKTTWIEGPTGSFAHFPWGPFSLMSIFKSNLRVQCGDGVSKAGTCAWAGHLGFLPQVELTGTWFVALNKV